MNASRQRRLSRSCPTLAEAMERYLLEMSTLKKSAYQERSLVRAWTGTLLAGRNLARITQQARPRTGRAATPGRLTLAIPLLLRP